MWELPFLLNVLPNLPISVFGGCPPVRPRGQWELHWVIGHCSRSRIRWGAFSLCAVQTQTDTTLSTPWCAMHSSSWLFCTSVKSRGHFTVAWKVDGFQSHNNHKTSAEVFFLISLTCLFLYPFTMASEK